MKHIVPLELIDQKILMVRGHRVMVDRDLAKLYAVSTKDLNQAVKRNLESFPEDFMFCLTGPEKKEVVTNCDHLVRLKFSPYLPYAFSPRSHFVSIRRGECVQLRLNCAREIVLHRPGRERRDARGDAGEAWHRRNAGVR